jgi:uncharacterized membrane protein
MLAAGYVKAHFNFGLHHSIFSSGAPLDSFNRLVTARRNRNLILLTLGWFMDRADFGLYSVIIWHLLSTGFLAVRVMMGC